MPLQDFLSAYRSREAQMQAQPMQQLQQAGALQGILAKMQAAQQEQELRGVLSQSGGDPQKAMQALLASGSPKAIELATHLKGLMPRPAEPYTLAADTVRYGPDNKPVAFGVPKADEQATAKIEAARVRAEDQSLSRAEQNQARMDMIRLTASLRQQPQTQPLVPVIGPDGKPRLVERKDAVGLTPAGAGSKAEATEAGKGDVDKDVMTLKSALDSLNTGGGITSTEKNVLPNIGRWASTTGPGQLLGAMGGTVNQKNRDIISQARPLLLRSIMQATGMSAKQLDSNAELKLWISTATDPTKGYEANVEALNNIASKFGSGGFMESGQTSKGTIKPSRRTGDWKDL